MQNIRVSLATKNTKFLLANSTRKLCKRKQFYWNCLFFFHIIQVFFSHFRSNGIIECCIIEGKAFSRGIWSGTTQKETTRAKRSHIVYTWKYTRRLSYWTGLINWFLFLYKRGATSTVLISLSLPLRFFLVNLFLYRYSVQFLITTSPTKSIIIFKNGFVRQG